MSSIRSIAFAMTDGFLNLPGGHFVGRVCTKSLTRSAWLRKLDRVRLYNLLARKIETSSGVTTRIPVPGRSGAAINVELALGDELSRQWYYFGYDDYEVPVCRLLTALVADLAGRSAGHPYHLLDVGGNIGYYTLLIGALAKLDNSAHVHAFEPSPRVFQILKRNVELNPGLPVTLNECAVCDSEGQQSLFLATEDFGHSSASLVEGGVSQAGSVQVKTTTLDSYVASLGGGRVALLKMDCEGVEAQVLAGMAATLERDSPHVVLEILPRYPSLPGDLAQQAFFSRYRKFLITASGLVEHDELKPSYENRDWLLSIDPPLSQLRTTSA